MKNLIITLVSISSLIACQSEAPKQEAKVAEPVKTEVKTDTSNAPVFACPMEPEITGKEGDKCSKCGMALVLKN
jgi:Heavy metal binding domain